MEDKNLYTAFEKYISDTAKQPKVLHKGDIIQGTIVDIRPGNIIVDVGFKSEGIVAGRELKADGFDPKSMKIGDSILVYVVKPEDEEGQLILSIRRTQQAGTWLKLDEAKKKNETVDVTVVESNNGGLIVEIGKEVRGFIPTSQLDATRVYADGIRKVGKDINEKVQKTLTSLVGTKIKTKIIELDREKNKIILSEKRVTQAVDSALSEDTLKKVKEGDTLKGAITGIAPFGVFVNAAGLEGLVHLSELSWDKVDDIGTIYKVGDPVSVMVIGMFDSGKRVAYSIKRLLKDPWSEAISKFKVGDVVDGVVQRVVPYGAFVRLGEGLNGLIHISEMSDKLVKNPEDIVKEGDAIKVKILSISSTERHLGLSIKALQETTKAKKISKKDLEKAVEEAIEEELPKE